MFRFLQSNPAAAKLVRTMRIAVAGGTGTVGRHVVDVVSVSTQKEDEVRAYFGTTTRTLLDAEKAAGVGHHVLLGIVGSQKSDHGYYAGKIVQEGLVHAGAVPWTEKPGPILKVPAPGPGGKAMRDGTLLPDPALLPPTQFGTQTFDQWLAGLRE